MSRFTLRACAWLALWGVGAGIVVPVLDADHAGRVDPEGRVSISAHLVEHDVPHLAATPAAAPGDHCAICHWQRSLGHAAPTSAVIVRAAQAAKRSDGLRAQRPANLRRGPADVRGPPRLS